MNTTTRGSGHKSKKETEKGEDTPGLQKVEISERISVVGFFLVLEKTHTVSSECKKKKQNSTKRKKMRRTKWRD